MDLTDIRRRTGSERRGRKRVGRGAGSGKGKTCGRGENGQGARAGSGGRLLAEGGGLPLFRRLPKVGFNNARFSKRYAIVNVGDLDEVFDAGDTVDLDALRSRRLVRNNRMPVKVLGDGELTKSLTVKAAKFSKSAEEKIASAGGTCKVV